MCRVFVASLMCMFFCDCGLASEKLQNDKVIDLLHEHCWGGMPSKGVGTLLLRNAYVLEYDAVLNIPLWVGYHVTADYLKTPQYSKEWSELLDDPSIVGELQAADVDASGYKPNRLAPYFISGGDRNSNGRYASNGFGDGKNDLEVDDLADALSVKQINYLTNVFLSSPNRAIGFSKVWGQIGSYNRDYLVGTLGLETWVFAGCIYDNDNSRLLALDDGVKRDPVLPSMLWKVIVFNYKGTWIAHSFLVPCDMNPVAEIENFMIPVCTVEALTGLIFFKDSAWSQELKLRTNANLFNEFWIHGEKLYLNNQLDDLEDEAAIEEKETVLGYAINAVDKEWFLINKKKLSGSIQVELRIDAGDIGVIIDAYLLKLENGKAKIPLKEQYKNAVQGIELESIQKK